MSARAGHLLGIYRRRRDMQRRGTTNPPQGVKQFCEDLVRELELLDPSAEVKLVGRGANGTDFVAAGKVLATLPAHEDPKWWREGEVG
jgi:hypothetical protein